MSIITLIIKLSATNCASGRSLEIQFFIVGSHRRIVQSNRFDFEPEITANVLKRKHKLYEMPISYYGRDFSEGKKITWRYGFAAIWALIKYRFMD